MDISTNSTTTETLLPFISQHLALFDNFHQVYLFGSALDNAKHPNDIDILLIYREFSNTTIDDINKISSFLESSTSIPIDLTALSIEEEKDTEFLKKLASNYLKIK